MIDQIVEWSLLSFMLQTRVVMLLLFVSKFAYQFNQLLVLFNRILISIQLPQLLIVMFGDHFLHSNCSGLFVN